jgi:hypothetical protein
MVEYTPEQLLSLTLSKLKKIGKEKKIPKYTSWKNVQDAVDAISASPAQAPSMALDVDTMSITDLKKMAKELNIPNFNKYKKDTISQLRNLVKSSMGMSEQQVEVVNEQVIEQVVDVDTMTITVLKKMAKELNIPNFNKYKKDTIGQLRTLVKARLEPEQVVVPQVVDIDSIKFRVQNLLSELSGLPTREQRSLLRPLVELYESLSDESPSPFRSPEPVMPPPEPVIFEMDEEVVYDSVIPDFIPAEEVDIDEMESIVGNMHETAQNTMDEELIIVGTNIEKCLVML